jgi:hypothetical protein
LQKFVVSDPALARIAHKAHRIEIAFKDSMRKPGQTCHMPDSLKSKPLACVASLQCCPSSSDQLSALAGMRGGRVRLRHLKMNGTRGSQLA